MAIDKAPDQGYTGDMVKRITTEGKRPADATPEKALELSQHLTLQEIARRWNISRQRVGQLVKKARDGNL